MIKKILFFILQYKQSGPNLWSFVLTAPNNNGYIAIRFSSNVRIKGSNIVAGWLPSSIAGIVKRYNLGGYSSGECPNGTLPSSDFLLPTHQAMISTSSTTTLVITLSLTILLSTIHHLSSVSNSENNCKSECILGRKDIGDEETSRDNKNGGMGSHLARQHRHCTLRKAIGSFLVLCSYLSLEFWLHCGNCLRRHWLKPRG